MLCLYCVYIVFILCFNLSRTFRAILDSDSYRNVSINKKGMIKSSHDNKIKQQTLLILCVIIQD